MANEMRTALGPSVLAAAWPPDDTEESVVGTDLHQGTIIDLRLGIDEAARTHLPPGAPPPWQALSQLVLLGCVRPDGSSYRTAPDIAVYRRPIDPHRGSVSLDEDGPPALVAEVLSESTRAVDLDLPRGKGYSYARAGVAEYLALDPTGQFLPAGLRAWRLEGGVYRPWGTEVDGRWHIARIGVAFGLAGLRVVVYTRDGQRMLRGAEVAEERARFREERARFLEERARNEAELTRLRRLLAERDGQG